MRARRPLVALFLALILLPLAANLAGLDGSNPLVEKRDLAAFPRLEPSWSSVAAYPEGLLAWFEDHFGFRSTLVRWYGEGRYFGLGVSPTTSVVKGRDGWLFYADDSGMADYTREDPLSPEQVGEWRDSIVHSRDWLKEQGIAYVFAIAPDKHVLYPEELPDTIRPLGHPYRMDQVFQGLVGSGVAAVDFRPGLFAAKARERIFEKTDTHWNERGAFVAYQQLVSAIREQVSAVPPAWERDDFEPVAVEVEGMDLAGMIGLQDVLREEQLRLVPRRPRLARAVEPPGVDPSASRGRLVTEIPGSTLPRALVFRDSCFSRLAPFLSEHFSRVVYLWQHNFDSEDVRRERPDVVIQEIVGRHLVSLSPYSDLDHPKAP
jgi:hypothetical protein